MRRVALERHEVADARGAALHLAEDHSPDERTDLLDISGGFYPNLPILALAIHVVNLRGKRGRRECPARRKIEVRVIP